MLDLDSLEQDEELEVISISTGNSVGIKGKYISHDKNNVTLLLNNGTKVTFKKDNLKRIT